MNNQGHSVETRVALLEQAMDHVERYARDRLTAHSERLTAIDERTRKLGSRVGQVSETVTQHGRALDQIEARRSRSRRDMIQIGAAIGAPLVSMLLIFGGALGWWSPQVAEKISSGLMNQVK